MSRFIGGVWRPVGTLDAVDEAAKELEATRDKAWFANAKALSGERGLQVTFVHPKGNDLPDDWAPCYARLYLKGRGVAEVRAAFILARRWPRFGFQLTKAEHEHLQVLWDDHQQTCTRCGWGA